MTEEPSEPPKEPSKKPEEPKPEPSSEWGNLERWVSEIGKWAWIIALVNGIISVFWGAWRMFWTFPYTRWFILGWYIGGGVVVIIFAIAIVKPRFSNKCAEKDWDFLLNDILKLGSLRFPMMFVWAIIVTAFGYYAWGGAAIWFPAIVLVVAGPKQYQWTEE